MNRELTYRQMQMQIEIQKLQLSQVFQMQILINLDMLIFLLAFRYTLAIEPSNLYPSR